MGAKHTPGPWEAFATPVGVGVISRRRADVAHCGGFDTDRPREEEEANARLIASAPDLLEALIELRDAHHGLRSSAKIKHAAYLKARAAIARATGEAA